MRRRAPLEGRAVGAVAPGPVDQVARREGLRRQRLRPSRRPASGPGQSSSISPETLACASRGRRRRPPRDPRSRRSCPPPSASISAARSSPTPAWIMYFATSTARGDSVAAFSAIARAAAPTSSATSATKPSASARSAADPPAEERHLLHHRLRQQPRHPLRPRPARHDPDARLRQRQRRPRRHHPDVAGGRQLQPAAEGVPVQRRDRRLAQPRQPVEDPVPLAHPVPREVERRHRPPGGDVGPGAEGLLARCR